MDYLGMALMRFPWEYVPEDCTKVVQSSIITAMVLVSQESLCYLIWFICGVWLGI